MRCGVITRIGSKVQGGILIGAAESAGGVG